MPKSTKPEYISIRTPADIKQLLADIADKECRTLSQQCFMIIRDWLKDNGHIKDTD